VYRHIGMGSDGSHFFSDRGKRSDSYRAYLSDGGRRAGEKWPRPEGLQPNPDGFSPGNAARSYMSIHPGPCFEGARLRSLRRKNQKPHGRTPKPATARFTPEQEASSPATRPSIGFGFRFTRKYYTFPFWARLDCVRANSIALEEQRL
jgi:hypothetical protein